MPDSAIGPDRSELQERTPDPEAWAGATRFHIVTAAPTAVACSQVSRDIKLVGVHPVLAVVTTGGLEPPASALSERCANQLRHVAMVRKVRVELTPGLPRTRS